MNKKQLDEKHQKILRKLLTLPENKKCFDCSEKGPFYACTTLGTFVCTTCSGIHREFQHHVKSISMASFKPDEVQFLEEMGNGRAKEIWLAHWTPRDYPEPESTDRTRVREFMKLKYERKKWFERPGGARNNGARNEKQSGNKRREEEPPRVEPIESILGKNIPPISITHNINLSLGVSSNGAAPRREEQRVAQPPAKPQDPFLVSWDEPLPPTHPAHSRSPQLPTQQFPTPHPATHAPPPSGGLSGLESVFTHTTEPAKNPMGSTVWPPPPAGGAVPPPHMGGPGAMPGAHGSGVGVFPPSGTAGAPFQQVSPQVFQQMPPAQQQQYLAMQQQWIQQQQFLLQQHMAGMNLSGAAPTGAGMMMPAMGHVGGGPGMVAYPGAAMHPGMPGGAVPMGSAMGSNPFLVGVPSGPTSGGVLAPSAAGRSGGAAPGTQEKKNDSLFADLSPLSSVKPAGSSAPPSPAAPVSRGPGIGMGSATASPGHSPFFPTQSGPTPLSPTLSPAQNPFAASSPTMTPSTGYPSGGYPPQPAAGSSNGGNTSFNPFGSLI